jgi:hypothetical protein
MHWLHVSCLSCLIWRMLAVRGHGVHNRAGRGCGERHGSEACLQSLIWHHLRAHFAATACTIVSGAIAERARLEAYILYSFFMASWVYPVLIHSVWSQAGWASMFRCGPPCLLSPLCWLHLFQGSRQPIVANMSRHLKCTLLMLSIWRAERATCARSTMMYLSALPN